MIYERFKIISTTEVTPLTGNRLMQATAARILPDGQLDAECTVVLTVPDPRLFPELAPGNDYVVAFLREHEANTYGVGCRLS